MNKLHAFIYQTLNALQRTGWRINADVLALVERVWADGGGQLGIPARNAMPKPADETPEDRGARLRDERERRAHVRRLEGTLSEAESVRGDIFYLVHHLDYRGRMYTANAWLKPESGELARALMEFAEGKPVGPAGAMHLAIHGANCYGVRGTKPEKVQWARDRSDAIV